MLEPIEAGDVFPYHGEKAGVVKVTAPWRGSLASRLRAWCLSTRWTPRSKLEFPALFTDALTAGSRRRDGTDRDKRRLARWRGHLRHGVAQTIHMQSQSPFLCQRKLTAILLADVRGYSRLMGADDEETLHRLRNYQQLIGRRIEENRGRLVETPGDALLAEFGSVVDAVRCAVAIQNDLGARNAELPADHRMDLRIGISLGDVLVDGRFLYGDGVNIAARLEPMAQPGGICISEPVYDNIKNKLGLEWEYLGEKRLKNIATPVRAYRALISSTGISHHTAPPACPNRANKPSIAVLPFDNMSGDSRQDYFADGITEDIITALSRFSQLFVTARNSTFRYRGKAVKVQDVGEELGVQYVVEGSVRKADQRVRIVAQLIDALTGSHLWAERYDRKLTDMFDLQEEMSQTIVATLSGRLEAAHAERMRRQTPRDMAAYDYLLDAKTLHHRHTKEHNEEALRALNKAIELDPQFAEAYAWKACVLTQASVLGYARDPETALKQAREAIEMTLSLDETENDVECHRILCEIHMARMEWDAAEFHHQRAFTLNPNDPRIVAQRGALLTQRGRPVEGEEWVRKAMNLDPYDAHRYMHLLGHALYAAKRHTDAAHVFRQIFSTDGRNHAELAAFETQITADAVTGARLQRFAGRASICRARAAPGSPVDRTVRPAAY